jgi:hypothetical protein
MLDFHKSTKWKSTLFARQVHELSYTTLIKVPIPCGKLLNLVQLNLFPPQELKPLLLLVTFIYLFKYFLY